MSNINLPNSHSSFHLRRIGQSRERTSSGGGQIGAMLEDSKRSGSGNTSINSFELPLTQNFV